MDKTIGRLLGSTMHGISEYIDSYIHDDIGLFIPSDSIGGSSLITVSCRPSYMVLVSFDGGGSDVFHYKACVNSPAHCSGDLGSQHYYCIMIAADYFEKRYLMYEEKLPVFDNKTFEICSDILKALNTFAFESSKSMMNSDITLAAQTEIITHWIIRSIIGETLDMRAISDDYSVARAQHYIELHFAENITVSALAKLGCISESTFNRRFKKETGRTPIEYLIDIRIAQAKKLLRRKNLSVTEVAMRCGFGTGAHFTACFAQKTGDTPSEYRSKFP